jgi:hypothetical protein
MFPSGFARAVAISGSTAVVGCPGDNGIVGNIGSVYVFQDDGFGTWDQVAKLRASDLGINNDAHFGTSISMSGSQMIVVQPVHMLINGAIPVVPHTYSKTTVPETGCKWPSWRPMDLS